MRATVLTIVICAVALVCGCRGGSPGHYTYKPPTRIDDGLDVSALTEAGIDPTLLEKAVDDIQAGKHTGVHSILIFRNDKLVFEEYFRGHKFEYAADRHHGDRVGFDRSMSHRVMSVTKSITSACIGIAVDKGFIESVDQSIFDYLPEHQYLKSDGKDLITIEHLLTMTSGLRWNEWAVPYSNPENDVIKAYSADDQVDFTLGKTLLSEPGTSFNYAGGCNLVLAEILRNATGMNIDEFSGKYLFGPLGIEPYYWSRYSSGMIDAAGSVVLTPRDMLKIGVTFLNGGVWNGTRVISEEWVEKSGTSYPGNSWMNDGDDFYGLKGYGYSWWTHKFVRTGKRIDMYYASGWGGQYIMVIPALNAVVVFTGGNYTTPRPCFDILKKYIIPAMG